MSIRDLFASLPCDFCGRADTHSTDDCHRETARQRDALLDLVLLAMTGKRPTYYVKGWKDSARKALASFPARLQRRGAA